MLEQKDEKSPESPITNAQIEQACQDVTEYQRRVRYLGHKRGRFENTPLQYVGLLLWLPLGVMVCAQLPNPSLALFIYFAVLSPLGVLSIYLWNLVQLRRQKQRYRAAQQTLIAGNRLKGLPTLLSILKAERNNAGAAEAITRLLPRLKPIHATLLDAEERDFLYECLRPPYTPELALERAILLAWEQIGDADTRRFLDRRLQKSGMPPPMMQAMQHCREVLYARELSAQRATTLLRASDAPIMPDAQLLRPTTATLPALPEQLLRATSDTDAQT